MDPTPHAQMHSPICQTQTKRSVCTHTCTRTRTHTYTHVHTHVFHTHSHTHTQQTEVLHKTQDALLKLEKEREAVGDGGVVRVRMSGSRFAQLRDGPTLHSPAAGDADIGDDREPDAVPDSSPPRHNGSDAPALRGRGIEDARKVLEEAQKRTQAQVPPAPPRPARRLLLESPYLSDARHGTGRRSSRQDPRVAP